MTAWILAIAKALAIWIVLSIPLSLLIAPALARRLRKLSGIRAAPGARVRRD
jgi:hypothetical protein